MRSLARTLPFLATFAVAMPVLAQEAVSVPDTIRVEGRTVIIIDGDRVRMPDDDHAATFRFGEGDDGENVVVFRNGARGAAPFVHSLPGDRVSFRAGADDLTSARVLREMDHALTTVFDNATLHASSEVRRMEMEARRLAQEVLAAEGAERQQREADLRAKLDALFDAKLAARAERIESLEAELARQRARYETRRSERDAIVDRRLRDLLGEDDVLDW